MAAGTDELDQIALAWNRLRFQERVNLALKQCEGRHRLLGCAARVRTDFPDPLDQFAGCSGAASGPVRCRSSFMNASNSDLSLAERSRSRNSAKLRCSSSSRRSVSARYSSKALLPLDGAARSPQKLRQPPQGRHDPGPAEPHAPARNALPRHPMRPLPIRNANKPNPSGHQIMKAATVAAIHSGPPRHQGPVHPGEDPQGLAFHPRLPYAPCVAVTTACPTM